MTDKQVESAFPRVPYTVGDTFETGLTKREYFAIHALAGILAGLGKANLTNYLSSARNPRGKYGIGREVDLAIHTADLLMMGLDVIKQPISPQKFGETL